MFKKILMAFVFVCVASVNSQAQTLTLWSTDTQTPIGPMIDGMQIVLSQEDHLSVVATNTVNPVPFILDGVTVNTENVVPYAILGDTGGILKSWTPTVGQHVLVVKNTTVHFSVIADVPVVGPKLIWLDNSDNEDGFYVWVFRYNGDDWSPILATLPMNTQTYTDTLGVLGDCYRVQAFNSVGSSGFTNVACYGVVLIVHVVGPGSVGECRSDCAASYATGTVIPLPATPDSDARFVGWTGDVGCGDPTFTLDTNKTCTATFEALPPPIPAAPSNLTVQ